MAKDSKKKYYKVDMDKVRQKAEELGAGTYWKPKEGKSVIRILPPWNDEGEFYFETALHYGFQVDGKNRAYPCLKALGEKECPACDMYKQLNEGSKEDKELAKALQPRRKFYVNVIDRANPSSVQIWGFSSKTLRTLLGYIQDPDWGDFTDPEEGNDVVVEREGTGRMDTKYSYRIKPKASAIDVEGWEGMMHDLSSEVVEEISEEELQEIVDNNYGSGAKRPKKKSSEDEEEEEETEEAEEKKSKKQEDEEEEEEKAPPKKKRRDEEEEEQEEEEEEKPKKKSRR